MVDAFSTIEQTRLRWFHTHQTTLRNELYNNICRSVSIGDVDSSNTGKGIVLPAGYVGSKRYMQQNFQDALAVCRYIEHPDIFLTMTCNSLWDKIQKMMEYVPGCIAPNCPDIISRVFRLKLDQLMVDIKDKKHFGVCIGVMYFVEFQKRGLPHVHMLIWLDADSKKNLKQNVDKFVSAEIPNPLLDLVGYVAVKEFMIHGPCGDKNCTFRANEALGKVAAREKNKFSKLEAFFYLNSVDVNARKYTYDEIPSTFRDAYKEYGLLDDDKEWHEMLTQASAGGLPPQVRQLFVHIIVNYELLRSVGKSLKKFDQLPQPPRSYLNNGTNNLIIEETSYDTRKMEYETAKLLQDCTEEQGKIYDAVIQSIDSNVGGIFFVYGSGGCGKTFLWRTLICKLRSQGKIMLPVASSGTAATLMPGGRTAHSRFKIPIVLDECSTCNIAHNSDIAQLIKQTQLIIWDEAPMQHRYAFECLDRSLKDIMKPVDPERYAMSFGGITVVLGGDFRQILPVITYGDCADIVAACITRSRLWSICQVFLLTENMRLKQGESDSESEELKKFAKWVLDIGNGQFCDVQNENTVDNMICSTYPNFSHEGHITQYLSERAILIPTNQTVGHLNSLIVDKLPRVSVSYFCVDATEEFGGTDGDLNEAFPIEYLNSLNVAGMPPHDLKLKVGAVVMLMYNLNQTLGLCNGIRMIVTKCLRFCVECEVICGMFVGSKHFISRMELSLSDTKMPFKLIRKQMALQICYAMTINKSQGQSLKIVGLYLPKSVFTHGQYYVAISRVTSPTSLTIFVDDESGAATNITQNVVYKEVFYGLPEA
ncbi:ATP-dependent DNA helicase RRM3-like [Apium graveolens]|uniref:ATP-dependent DNA helicase RRM3-like n=1 Tax=Apium graveolens TaxID=4045 RepID=UPI003D7BC202